MLLSLRSKPTYRNAKLFGTTRSLLVFLVLLGAFTLPGQTNSSIVGTVTGSDGGQPIAGVVVYGGSEEAITDQNGRFRMEKGGPVIHFVKDKLRPKAYVIGSGKAPINIIMELSTDNLVIPVCAKVKPGQQRIGWGKYGLQFNVIKREFKILGGEPDVDYTRYVIKPKAGGGYLQLWFGLMAIGELPDDDQFINSDNFAQRNVVSSGGDRAGTDSRGQQRDGSLWRHTAVMGEGGSIYRGVTPEEASLFDHIVNSLCVIPYRKQK